MKDSSIFFIYGIIKSGQDASEQRVCSGLLIELSGAGKAHASYWPIMKVHTTGVNLTTGLYELNKSGNDYSGRDNHATLYDPSWTINRQSRPNSAFRINKEDTDTYFTVPAAVLSGTVNFTVGFWVKLEDTGRENHFITVPGVLNFRRAVTTGCILRWGQQRYRHPPSQTGGQASGTG
ncbi:hypothetical protein CHS0354_001955 [Potamilus streckersoni]|uniref:Uncharacterized protein n=1 Tax=Potamilus streckersoni TaxID=2493646 RepID=A0AAE0T6M4_9BIVA|nr:hypothetical protein CHS0354_001955 [Potamilus streckersoni]